MESVAMQIVIPMSGFGERFRRAGYTVPKPLIPIDGKPIIAHVLDMFPGEQQVFFICNQDHLDNPDYRMLEQLKDYCPTGQVIGIAPHKLGPVHAVRQIADWLNPAEPVIVNYCDFTCYWDWTQFKQFVKTSHCDGAIPAYKGFHPHTLGTTNYAYMQETDGWVTAIQEKQPYTDNRMEEYASSGTYYFKSAQLMLDAFAATQQNQWQVGGEYYVSLTYKHLFEQQKSVAVYPLQHFMQWGTPDDVAEYRGWSDTFRRLLDTPQSQKPQGAVVIPMAGLGERFSREGYTQTKPLIPVSGKPMVMQAVADLPPAEKHVFVLRQDMPGADAVANTLTSTYPGAQLEWLPQVTEGQACTALIGLQTLLKSGYNPSLPVTFGACDNGAIYHSDRFTQLMADPMVDVLVWVARGHANAVRNPQQYGWVKTDESGRVTGLSVKTPLDNPANDPIVLGTFTFKRAGDALKAIEALITRDGRINNEFYLDSAMEDALSLGLNVQLFEVDHYMSWGTPNDLRTFEYWQSCFHKWAGHPYQLAADSRIAVDQLTVLENQYQAMVPKMLKQPMALSA
jgi:NDP-sugar pyrophosphorylase family protein